MTEYVGVLLYIRFATGLGVVILFAAAKVAPRRLDLEKATAYECGFEPFGEARSPFDVGFYLVAILFLVFDLEARLLLPWVLSGVRTGFSGFFCLILFLVVLVLGFIYEWSKGALDWTSFIFLFIFLYSLGALPPRKYKNFCYFVFGLGLLRNPRPKRSNPRPKQSPQENSKNKDIL